MRISDWSADVCSSDLLLQHFEYAGATLFAAQLGIERLQRLADNAADPMPGIETRLRILKHHLDVAPQRAPALLVQTLDFVRSEEHTSELQSLMRISYAVFCLKKKKQHISRIKH